MSNKYIKQIDNNNFVFPNNTLAEYDAEIIHDLKENSVQGVLTGFSPLTYSASTQSVGVSFTYQWSLNGAEPFISNDNKLNILSVHMQSPDKKYYKPWICVAQVQDNNVNLTYKTDTFTVFVTPQMMGQTVFTTGTFYFEIRFLGHRAVFPISVSGALAIPTPTPTPSPTPTGPTPTPGGPTPTPTPTATPSNPCYCYEILVTGNTLPPPEGGVIATLDYNDCYGTRTARAFTVGPGTYYQCIQTLSSVVQWHPEGTSGIDTSNLLIPGVGNCNTGYVCTGYTPASTPTPTPTSTGAPATATPTPTPTATGAPATATPTPTATGVPPTDTPTPTPTATGVPPTDTPTPTPTDTPTPTPTSTPTPTPFETTFSGYVSIENGPDACGGGGYSNVNITVVGTTLCNATKVKGLSSPTFGNVWGDFANNQTFWVSNGTDEREFMRDGSAQEGTPQTACTACAAPTATPTPTPTATPTPTPGAYTSFGGCGYGSTTAGACNDAGINNRTLYSNCDNVSIGVGCIIYSDSGGTTPLTGYTNVYLALVSWDVNSSTGAITATSSEQC